jgi:hypothetical protein
MNDNEKRKIDSIIVRIALILGLGFLAVEAGRNVISISSQNSFPELEQQVREAERRGEKVRRAIEEAKKVSIDEVIKPMIAEFDEKNGLKKEVKEEVIVDGEPIKPLK